MTMYKAMYWTLGILLGTLLVIGVVIFVQSKFTPSQSTPNTSKYTYQTQGSGSSNSNSSTVVAKPITSNNPSVNTLNIAGASTSLMVKDFLHNGETVPDTVNPGYYFLAGSIGYCLGNGTCPSGYKSDQFMVTYNTATEQFNVILLKEPLAASRNAVEEFLMDRLGLHRIILCNLRYYVSVPSAINSTYAGKNLGFSVCPGATVLPQ